MAMTGDIGLVSAVRLRSPEPIFRLKDLELFCLSFAPLALTLLVVSFEVLLVARQFRSPFVFRLEGDSFTVFFFHPSRAASLSRDFFPPFLTKCTSDFAFSWDQFIPVSGALLHFFPSILPSFLSFTSFLSSLVPPRPICFPIPPTPPFQGISFFFVTSVVSPTFPFPKCGCVLFSYLPF